MTLLSKLIAGASLFAAVSTASAQLPTVFMDAADQVKIIVEKTDNGDGTFSYNAISPNANVIESDILFCNGSACNGFLKLKTDGPVDFSGFYLGPHVSYAYAYVTSPTIGFDLSQFENTTQTHIHEAYTYPSTDPSVENFVASGNSRADITDFDGSVATIKYFFEELPMISGATTQYQTFQLVGFGKQWVDIEIGDDFRLPNTAVTQSTNKGSVYSFFFDNGYTWNVVGWAQGTGHYADFRFLTNGDSRYDDGLNLSGYNTIEFTIECDAGMTIETFFGGEDDSSQNFLSDIACDGTEQFKSFNISGANKADIQTALWLHVPVWKNYNLGQEYDLAMRVKDVKLKQ